MGGSFVHRSYSGIRKPDSELDDRKVSSLAPAVTSIFQKQLGFLVSVGML